MSPKSLAWSTGSIRPQNANHNIAADVLRAFVAPGQRKTSVLTGRRSYATQEAATNADVSAQINHKDAAFGQIARQRKADRQFFVDLLNSAATKRDAKAFISRLKSPSQPTTLSKAQRPVSPLPKSQVNLGNLFGRSRAVEASPVFSQHGAGQEHAIEEQVTLHVALVKITNLSQTSDEVLSGIAQTLSQLARLSMAPCVVIDEPATRNPKSWRKTLAEQADRLVTAIEAISETGARRLNDVLSIGSDGRPQVYLRKMLLRPLRKERIPIVMPVAYSEDSQSAVNITGDEAMLALATELAGLNIRQRPGQDPDEAAAENEEIRKQIALDRIIVIDETGGIPSTKSVDKMHVFVNLEQEYHQLQEELRSSTDKRVSQSHATNLRMLRRALQMLPGSASGLITTPMDAANSSRNEQDHQVSSVGTRRQKNPLIHNLLTDKPAYSASLPSGRLGKSAVPPIPTSVTTFVKHGMPLRIVPDPAAQQWTPNKQPWLKLTDPRIDLDRLVYLIDDSFSRKLDVEAYLKRVNDRIAGVIIAGEYEGGAILTWETPPGVDPTDKSRLVPYLDKFAVLKKSQGAGGVADILFNAMVRVCFPGGVCWRSRKDNPVNKWYFERSRGTWKIPDMNWTMFWTTPGVLENDRTFFDYEAVCRGVQPTWADNKKIQD